MLLQFQCFLKGCDIKTTNLELLWAVSASHSADLSFLKETFFPVKEQNCLVRRISISLCVSMLFLGHSSTSDMKIK